jgi:hypothetical protein
MAIRDLTTKDLPTAVSFHGNTHALSPVLPSPSALLPGSL